MLNEANFRNDLCSAPWSSIKAFYDPSNAHAHWCREMFQNVVERHVPQRTKQAKYLQFPKWTAPEILTGIRQRDDMKQRARKGTIPWKMFTRLRNKNI